MPFQPLTRRLFFASMASACVSPARAERKPFAARLFSAGFDGTAYKGGLHVVMDPGWKTYWRVPGEGGIPPVLEAAGNNIANFSFDCPLPHRLSGEGGETIGYKHEVVFPWTLTPIAVDTPMQAELSAFIGVCETVCIPVPVKETLALQPGGQSTPDTGLLVIWKSRVPKVPPTPVVTAASVSEADGGLVLDVTLASPVSDIFVEGKAMHFFAPPLWGEDGRLARIPVRGAKSADELKRSSLRFTLDVNRQALEQTVTVG